MSDITVKRYPKDNGSEYSGWIEDKAATWIVFLDLDGKPKVYYGERDDLGGVTSEPVLL